jgi:4-hydroxy-tetrahydrodipicolinate synthase
MYTVAHDEWKGVMHAVVTPFDADGAIDETAFRENIASFLAEGVHGVVLGGDNGEAWALSDDELTGLTRLTRRIIDEAGSAAKLAVGADDIPTARTVEAVKRIADAGADGAMVGPPTHLVTATLAELMTRFETLARQGGLPLVLYNNPRRTQINLTPDIVDRLADVDGIVAIKDSVRDFAQHSATIERARDRINVMLGPCTQIFPSVLLGGAGYISTGPDILGRAGVEYYHDLAAGRVEQAAPVHFKLQRIYAALNGIGTWPAGLKAALDLVGKRGGYPRPPILPLGPAERERIRAVLAGAGLLPDGQRGEEAAPALAGATR